MCKKVRGAKETGVHEFYRPPEKFGESLAKRWGLGFAKKKKKRKVEASRLGVGTGVRILECGWGKLEATEWKRCECGGECCWQTKYGQ